jgi:hypothetical protein
MPEAELPVLVLFGLKADEEVQARTWIYAYETGSTVPATASLRERVGTDTPRLRVGEPWTDVLVLSEPFVIPTVRGYAPAILVRRRSVTYKEHLLVGARSIAIPLEELRLSTGSLVGQSLSIRKTAGHQSAPYEVKIH